jgi:hypothetical protein
MESSVCHLPPLNTYAYVHEENSGLIRKFIENYFLFVCITYVHYTRGAWDGGGTFLRQQKKSSSSPCTASVICRVLVCHLQFLCVTTIQRDNHGD